MDIHVDIRGFLEIHAWICYGFSEQGSWHYNIKTVRVMAICATWSEWGSINWSAWGSINWSLVGM